MVVPVTWISLITCLIPFSSSYFTICISTFPVLVYQHPTAAFSLCPLTKFIMFTPCVFFCSLPWTVIKVKKYFNIWNNDIYNITFDEIIYNLKFQYMKYIIIWNNLPEKNFFCNDMPCGKSFLLFFKKNNILGTDGSYF